MTKGRRNDKTYTAGVPTDRKAERAKLVQQGSGIDGRVAPPSREALREFIASQTCPWCGAGPFRVLAIHTNGAHGVSASELRDLAGLTRHAPLCAEDYSAERAAMLAGQALPPIAYERLSVPHVLSEAGRRTQRAKSQAQPPASKLSGARASGDAQLAANADRHREILRRYAEGEPVLAIVSAVGMSRPTVQRTLVRAGVWIDGRTRRWRP